jgi:hypothetical protein
MLILFFAQVALAADCSTYTNAFTVACTQGATSCSTPACPSGTASSGSCDYYGVTAPICSVTSPQFFITCASSSTVDSTATCLVKVASNSVYTSYATTTAITTFTTFVAPIVSNLKSVTILDGASGNTADQVTITGSTGLGSFTVSSQLPLASSALAFQVPYLSGILASSPGTGIIFTPGSAIAITLISVSPSNFNAGDTVTLSFSALDQYANVATGVTGLAAVVSATPSSLVTWIDPATLTFASGSASVRLTASSSTQLITVSLSAGSAPVSGVTYGLTANSYWSLSFTAATAAYALLSLSKSSVTQGSSVTASVTIVDKYNNVNVGVSNWRFLLKVSGSSGTSSMYGLVQSGKLSFSVTWNTAETVTVLLLNPDSNSVSLPSSLSLTVNSSLDTTSIIAICVSIGCALIMVVVIFFVVRQKRLNKKVAQDRQQNVSMIRALVSLDGDEKTSSEAAIVAEDTKRASEQVNQTQALLLSRIANMTGGHKPGDAPELSKAEESALGVVGYLHKVDDVLNKLCRAPVDSNSEEALLNDLLTTQGSKYLSPTELLELKKLADQVLSKLRPKRLAALEKSEKADMKMTEMITTTHAVALSALLKRKC